MDIGERAADRGRDRPGGARRQLPGDQVAGRGAELMAVVKADAYGHGAIEVARALRSEGCGHFGVARVGEARELRAAGVGERIYLLGGFFADEAAEIVGLDVTPFVYDVGVDRAAGARGRSAGAREFPDSSENRHRRDPARNSARRTGSGDRGARPCAVADSRRRVHVAGQCRRSAESDDRARNSKCSTPRWRCCGRRASIRRVAHVANSAALGAAGRRAFQPDAPRARDLWIAAGAGGARAASNCGR